MGKYILLTVLAVALGTVMLSRQGMLTDLRTSESQAERQKQVFAREIARSAFELGLSELRRDFENYRVDRTHVEHEGGYFDLDVSGPTSGPVSITAVGHHGDRAYEITGEATKDTTVSSLANGITASIPITFDVSGPGCEPCVSGLDVTGGDDRHGITLPPGADAEEVCDEFDGEVVGRGGGCDVKTRTEDRDDWVESQMTQLDSDIQDAIDAGSDDVKVCDTDPHCDVSDYSDNSGIMYVTSELRFNGDEQWNGLVFVTDGGSVRINGGGDVKNINGGLMMADSTDFARDDELDLNGGNAVHYNSAELQKYLGTVPTMRTMTIQVSGRTERVVRSSE